MAAGCVRCEQLRLAFTQHSVNDVYVGEVMKAMAVLNGKLQEQVGRSDSQ